jgi:hypothetical protein
LHRGSGVIPYKHAHYYLVLLILLMGLAFWPTYLSVLPDASAAVHIHSLTASIWIALLTFQSWAIHQGRRAWHRAVGISSLAVFPLFFVGSILIAHQMATEYASGDFFNSRFGTRFAAFDLVGVFALGMLFWSALRWRRNVQLHTRWMLGTVFFLLEPVFARLLPIYVPGFQPTPPEFARMTLNVELTSAGALLLALWLAWKQPKHGRPWLIIASLLLLQMVFFSTVGVWKPWQTLVSAFAAVPAALVFGFGLALGAIVSWHGWNSVPRRPQQPLSPARAVEA